VATKTIQEDELSDRQEVMGPIIVETVENGCRL